MGRTSKPLKVLVTRPEMLDWSEVDEQLIRKGHSVQFVPDMQYDLILGPECGIMQEKHRPFLKHHIDRARAQKYPKSAPMKDENDD